MAVFTGAKKRPVLQAVQNGRQAVGDNMERVSRSSRRAARRSRDYARRHPWMTAGVLTGAAVAASTAGYAMLRRRRK